MGSFWREFIDWPVMSRQKFQAFQSPETEGWGAALPEDVERLRVEQQLGLQQTVQLAVHAQAGHPGSWDTQQYWDVNSEGLYWN